jgi:preprotein translocase subunit SecD
LAPPAKSAPHPGRALAVLAALIIVMLLGVLGGDLASPSHWHKDFRVGLGLDLSSGTEVTMIAQTPNGKTPSSQEMTEAVSIITSRVNGTGNSGATVQTQGSNIINVSVPGKPADQVVKLVSTTALLRFRQVLREAAGTATTPAVNPSPSASATPSSSASPHPSSSSTAKASSSPSASAAALGQSSTARTSAKIVPDASVSASPGASASAGASAHASSSPSATASASPSPSASSSTPATAQTVFGAGTVDPNVLKLFNKLTCKAGYGTKNTAPWKKQVGYTTSGDWDNLSAQTVACDDSGNKYLLAAAKVRGEDVTGASAQYSTTNQWQVILTFNGAGSTAFGTLTENLYNTYYSAAQTGNQNDVVNDQVAIVLDGGVVSAPEIQGAIPGGTAQITGSFTQADATNLANILKYGSLPVYLNTQNVQSVSPTLGKNQLDAGLLAGAIGLILVVVYSFLYYRGLGLVSISSLMIAALLGYLAVVLLSKYQSFTLDLAGIAGLVVAIGITADSFVVFFERLRDEVREGKQLRPAVESGWRRARRTILVSDTVSFLAALLLYYFAISDVKGFAYTLGLTTLIDIVVVFLFTKPMVTLVARTRFYGNGHRLSGLDPARLGARAPWRSSVRVTRTRTGSSARTSSSGRNSGEA